MVHKKPRCPFCFAVERPHHELACGARYTARLEYAIRLLLTSAKASPGGAKNIGVITAERVLAMEPETPHETRAILADGDD